MSFLVIALAVLALMATVYMNVVRPAQKRHKAAPAAPEPIPVADPKVPSDMSRPYPRGDSAATEEMLRTCPICGMTDLDQILPDDVADFFGWPAHASCKEWLGDWVPARPAPPPYKPDRALIGYIEQGQKPPRSDNCCDGCGTPLGTGVRCHDKAGHHYCPACDREQRRRKEGAYAPTSSYRHKFPSDTRRATSQPPPVPTPAEYLAELQEHLHHFEEKYPG